MKILILLDSLAIGGGAERIATTLGDELYQRGNDISYLTFQDKSPKYKFKGEYHTLNCQNTSGNVLKRVYDFIINSKKINDLCNQRGIETIISVGENANFHAVLSRMLFGNQSGVIISQHINPLIHLQSKLKVQLINYFYSKADKTVCVSKEIETILNNNFNIKNTTTIYNMIDLEEIKRLSKEKITLNDKFIDASNRSGFIFINVGSLYRQKGQWFLIRSFRKVIDHHPDCQLFILGEGPLREELKNLIKKLNLENNVFLLGNRDNVFPYLKKSHCFVFTSLWEGLPMTLLETLALSVPIISTDCMTGPREILCPELGLNKELNYPYHGKYGILTHPFQNQLLFWSLEEVPLNEAEEMMAHLMMEIIEDPQLRKKYSNGRERAGDFDKDNIISDWIKLL